MKFKTPFNNLDLLTIPISLSYKDKYLYRTFIGASLSIIFFIIIIIYIIVQFIQVIRKSSFTIISNEFQNPKNSINFTNVPILFSLTDDIGNPIEFDSKIAEYSVILNEYIQNFDHQGNSHMTHREKNIEIERCDKLIDYNYLSQFKSYNLSFFQCIKPNQNITINGLYGDINGYRSLKINIKKCDILKGNCYQNDYIDSIISNSRFSIIYLGYKTNFYDLKKLNDIEQTIYSRSITISPYFLKRVFYYMTLVKYKLNDNLFINNEKEKIYYINRATILESEPIKNESYDKNTLAYFSFVFDGNVIEYIKKVQKFIEALSYLANFFNILLTLFKIINNYFSNKILFLDIFYNFFFEKKFERSKTHHFNISNFSIISNQKEKENTNSLKINTKTQNKSNNLNSSICLESVGKSNKNLNVFNILNSKNKSNLVNGKGEKSFNNMTIEKEKNNFIKNSKFYYLCPFCIIRNSKNFETLLFVKNSICSCFSLESFIHLIKIMKTLERDKNNNIFYNNKNYGSSNNLKDEINKIFSLK